MFSDPSGATTPVAPIASRPQEQENDRENDRQNDKGGLDRGLPPSRTGAESSSVKSPEPHWDSVIGAATD
jgi:hypothetical protein